MSADFDVVVIGAGPGGSNAAATALRAGLRVAQVERFAFPRVKPCAGGLTPKACRSLAFELEPALRRRFQAFEFNVWSGREHRFTHQSDVLSMVLRPEFDNYLVERNRREPGFVFHDGERVRTVRHERGAFHVTTDRRTLVGRQLVGADGANGVVNRVFAISRPKARAAAVEVNLGRDVARARRPLLPCFDFGVLPRGYGWVFPKDDQWSVGLYTLAGGVKNLRRRLADYVRAKGFEVEGDPLATFEAHLIPVGGYRLSPPDVPVYLVGDAGGFADALTGEGIFHALESGRLAGEAAAALAAGEGDHRRYYRRLWRRVLCDTFLTYHLSGLFYRDVGRALRFVRLSLAWRPLVYGYGAGANFTESLARCAPYLWRSWVGRTSSLVSSHGP